MCIRPDGPSRRGAAAARGRRQRGVTLVELVLSLVLAGIVMATLWGAWSMLGRASADPLVMRQQLAVAQALLREIELQPLPGTATAAPTPGRTGFASIADYDGLVLDGIADAEGTPSPGLAGYRATVSVTPQAWAGVPAGDGWWVRVTVAGPGAGDLELAQWRARR